MKLTNNPNTIQSHKTNKPDNTDLQTSLCSFTINLRIKKSDDKPRKLNYENKFKKNSQWTVQATHQEGLIALEGGQ